MTAAQTEASNALKESFAHSPVVIVGNGPVGVKAAQLILKQSEYHHVVIYGDEKYAPYNRVQLSLYLSGKIDRQQLANPVSLNQSDRLIEKIGHRITKVDIEKRLVKDDHGEQQRFSKLIIATGSSPFVPNIPGKDKSGVHVFRSIDDANELLACRLEKKRILVIGSGALGLETAVAMKTPSNEVFVGVRQTLLSKSLDRKADKILKERIESSGIQLINKDPVCEILGDDRVNAVKLESGQIIDMDTVVFCAGIRPNIQLAKTMNLETQRGILVNDYMETNVPGIYAIGECAEHDSTTYGVVAPGFEQAETSVNHILGNYNLYKGSINNLQLKIEQHTTCIYGDIDSEAEKIYVYTNRLKGVFRKILVTNYRIQGVIFIGDWEEELKIKDAVQSNVRIRQPNLEKFETTGLLWEDEPKHTVRDQPEDYIVCLCESVTRGTLTSAMNQGNRTLDSLCDKTGAGKTCGSCKPLLAQILDAPVPNLVMRHHRAIYFFSIFSLFLIALLVFNEPISSSMTVQVNWRIEQLWFDSFWKQVSGYTLLGLVALGGAISVRKRWKKLKIGNLDNWRYAHSIIGVTALLVLFIHTGFRLGENLNFVLMAVFLAATTTGSLVGVFMSKNHHWTDLQLREHRKWWSRVHYTLLWLLPALLAYHIFAVYYF